MQLCILFQHLTTKRYVANVEFYCMFLNLLKHCRSCCESGAAGMAVNPSATSPPRRYVAYTAAFSRKHTLQQVYEFLTTHLKINREDMRLWKVKDEVQLGFFIPHSS